MSEEGVANWINAPCRSVNHNGAQMSKSKSYKTIFKCVAVSFVLLHVVWGVRSGRLNPIPRIPFTVIFTIIPGLITALVVRFSNVSTGAVVLIYIVIFWLLQVCLALAQSS